MKIFIVFIGIVLFTWILQTASENDQVLLDKVECVKKEALAQGYAGDANSVEAWDLFINKCN